MTVIINPGSGPIAEGEGWTNTFDGAVAEARRWLAEIRAQGIVDVELFTPGSPVEPNEDGRWRFEFRHQVTGVSVFLETHGIDDMAAYMRGRIFDPRVYWNGSSCSEPVLQDWAASGFRALRTFVAEYVTNDDDRGFVRHHWGDLELDWDPDEEDDR